MISWPTLLTVAHVIGLALAVGAATAKLVLLVRSGSDPALVAAFIAVCRPVTRVIILGLALVSLSGIGWLLTGYPFTPVLIAKLIMVGIVWITGPVIDNAVEPKFRNLAPAAGAGASTEFRRVRRIYLALEFLATGMFYTIIVIWLSA
jgi:hypothetical protein